MAAIPSLRAESSDVRVTWTEALARFVEWGRKVRQYTKSTLAAYQSDLGAFVRFLTERYRIVDPRDVAPAHVEEWLQSQGGLAPSTLCRRLDCVSTFFRYLVRHGLADRNPAEDAPRPREPVTLAKWVPWEEVQALRQVTQTPFERAVFEVLAVAPV